MNPSYEINNAEDLLNHLQSLKDNGTDLSELSIVYEYHCSIQDRWNELYVSKVTNYINSKLDNRRIVLE